MFFLADILRRQAIQRPNAPALEYRGTSISYAELQDQTNRLAHALVDAGVQRGDHVAILGKNGPEYVTAYFGCPAAGGIITCVNYRLADPEFVYIITNCEADILLLDYEFVAVWERIAGQCPNIRQVVLIGDEHTPGYTHFDDFVAGKPVTAPDVPRHEDDIALQMYTSGTTGVPKGAMLTHRNLVTNAQAILIENELVAGERFLLCAPLYHMAAGICTLLTLMVGGEAVVQREFVPPEVLKAIEEQRINHSLLIPAMILFLISMPDVKERDFSSMRTIVYGASPIPYEVLKRAMEIFGCGFSQGYGQTECTAVLTMLTAADHDIEGARGDELLKSAGRELQGVEVRVVDEDGRPVARGEWGEVIGRSASVMKGYWNMPEKTAEAIRDGWLWTGDIGYFDDEGYLYIVDRSKDMIISGGENIYPREIEEVLFAHEGIADAAVIGVPNPDGWGEEVKACVVRAPGAELSDSDVIAFCRERLAGYKCPRTIDFIDQVPRNLSGKVLKKDLREPYWEGHERQVH